MGHMLGLVAFTFLCYGFWANPQAVQYPPSEAGSVKNIFVGKLTCAARLNDATHVQFWCIKDGVVIHNELNALNATTALTFGYADDISQTFPDPVEAPAWIRWIVANVELSPGTVSYQVGYSVGGAPEKMLSGQF